MKKEKLVSFQVAYQLPNFTTHQSSSRHCRLLVFYLKQRVACGLRGVGWEALLNRRGLVGHS